MNQELLYKYFKGIATIEEEKLILDWVEASENETFFVFSSKCGRKGEFVRK